MAQTPGVINGTIIKLLVDDVEIALITSSEINQDQSTRDTSSKDSGGWKESLEGQKSWGTSGSGWFAEDTVFGYEELWDEWNGRNAVTVKISSSVSGDVEYSGSARITNLKRTDPNEESSSMEVSLEGTGPLAKLLIV